MRAAELPTPALVADRAIVEANLAAMAARWPGRSLRTHVKAHKSTALARLVADAGHDALCAATAAEVIGLAEAGLGADLLLANELVDPGRLRALADAAERTGARITVAVDSPETVDAAAAAGLREVLVDVHVGLPRCGCHPDEAGALADRARAAGLEVRGTMGYEGHATAVADATERAAVVAAATARLAEAHEAVGGDVISGGATMTWDANDEVTELQAGTFLLMDTHFEPHVPFRVALALVGTVLSVHRRGRQPWAVIDVGLKALGMDHGPPVVPGWEVWVVSDEHATIVPGPGTDLPAVGDRITVLPAHLDPTVARHDRIRVIDSRRDDPGVVVDEWAVDLRGW